MYQKLNMRYWWPACFLGVQVKGLSLEFKSFVCFLRESRPYKNILKKEYIQKKVTGNINMVLFRLISGVKFPDLC